MRCESYESGGAKAAAEQKPAAETVESDDDMPPLEEVCISYTYTHM